MMRSSTENTFYFYDFETWGTHPALDRPSQFAGVRTDSDFNVIGEPLVIYCQPTDDYLPQPEAVMITGITPQLAAKKGVCEADFARQIHQQFSVPNTCIVGYNNIRFDDEVTRNIFYRNFIDPYAYSWQNHNSRWDLLDVVRACYALRPDGIEWPEDDDGLPSFKLERLTRANGIEHTQAHDAMSDVYATIAMAKRLKQAQPKLFDYFLTHRHKRKISALLDLVNMSPLVHVSGMFGAWRGNTSWIAPIAWHPHNQNAVIVVDLAGDITPLLTESADVLREKLYTPTAELAAGESRLPLKLVHINKCPILAPAKTLLPENAERLGINREACLAHLQRLRETPELREKLVAIFAQEKVYPAQNNVDAQLYDGFFSDADKVAMRIIQQTSPEQLGELDLQFTDKRITPLLFRHRARNYPQTLTAVEQQQWFTHRHEALTAQAPAFVRSLEDLANFYDDNPEKLALLKALYDYGQQLMS
ncbi:exodeoxyribonuclease I [Plesiomonas sp.]|uniref:exodeoxyribonuclease I n=1 Tax=Plesiomonas sp. TaxID=2486279 RepID=UPI003F3125B8